MVKLIAIVALVAVLLSMVTGASSADKTNN